MGDLSDDLAFGKMWDEAADEYVKSTRKHRRSPPPSTEDVLAMIQEDQEQGSKREEHRSNVRAVLDRVVVIGEFAAGGASAAFPPSELCSTAIFYLVQTAWEYGEQKTAIANLFSEMTTFLECFNIYANAGKVQERIDIRLKSQIRRLLQCFIWVCGRYTAVANEPALMRLLKAGIRYDNGVKDKLSEIQGLSNKISEMRDTRTHVQVLNTDMAVESLQNVQMQKMEQKTSDRWQETIKKALNIDDAQLGWHETQNAHLEDIEDSTGSWLFERDDFRNWAGSRRSPTPPVFALEAGDGYGRSYLCAAIINYLQQTPPDPGFKTFAGFYYFDKDEKDTSSMKKALRAIIWQLSISKGNKAFTRCFADKCEDSVPLSKPYDLWQHSVMECSQPGSQIFIVIDGIGHASEDYWELAHIIRDVLSFEKDRISIRLLLTGAKADLDELRDHLQPDERSQITSLTVTDHNKSDLRQFISKRMRKVSKSWEPNSDNEDFREEVVEGLLESTDGDYEKLNLNLEDISQKVGKEEIRDVLKRANEPREETIKREVDRLEKTLGEREIDSLNEALPWIILPRYDWPSLKQLKAVIFLQHGKKPLMSLQKLIQEKYAPLLVVDGRLVRSYSTLKYFKKERGSQVSKETEAEVSSPTLIKQGTFDGTVLGPLTRATTFNNTSRVHEVEVALVKRLLSTVCDEDLFAKFGFTDFFMRLQNHSGKSIHFERVDGHARIIHTCLKALCSQDKRSRAESEPLVDYAITNLRWHLSQIDLPEFDHASTQKRGAIGKLLYNLFMDKNCVEAWLTPGRSQQIRQEWLTRTPRRNQKTLAEEVFKWFRDPDVVGGIGPHGRERINSIIYGSRKSGDLFREATKAMAGNWLLRQDWDVAQALWWILGFIQDVSSPLPTLVSEAASQTFIF
ncbi:hypothetical protein GTA08_BOTSDO05102 [Neofusicoccum parvum]|nr:hypothetical protein GTA08_BOTSDO05102 [Neofusicoccum parvum]